MDKNVRKIIGERNFFLLWKRFVNFYEYVWIILISCLVFEKLRFG